MPGDRQRVRTLLDEALAAQQAASVAFDEEYPAEGPTPEPPPVIRVPCSENVQAALDEARVIGAAVLLEVGEHRCNLVVRNDPAALPVLITSDTENIPGDGQRVTREYEHGFACLKAANTQQPVIRYDCGSSAVHLLALAILPSQRDRTLIAFGTDTMTSPDQMPHDVVHDRIIIRGDPTNGQRRGIQAHALRYTLRNSCLYDLWDPGSDAQAVAAWNGGQYLTLRNNALEASGEVLMFGGGDAKDPSMVPQYITIEDCTVSKNPAWIGAEQSKNNKCLLEVKHCQHLTIRRNLFEHQWPASWGHGEALVIRCTDQYGREPWTLTSDVLIEHNVIRKIGMPFNISAHGDPGTETKLMERLTIRHNLCHDIDTGNWQGKGAVTLASNLPHDLVIDHNTVVLNNWGIMEYWYNQSEKGTGFTFSNNVVWHGKYALKGPSGMNHDHWAADMGYAPLVSGNALRRHPDRQCKWPAGNTIIPEADFDASLNADYSVKPGSAIAAVPTTDGQPIGCDLTRLPTVPGRRSFGVKP
jgi:hypothetical protein